ncbi:carboxymuconolactone decarboxylase family protein [Flammeovirga yaeyamensis]|uniref:Carboxymuconolactone decarboxylase family protein n=1 Tax=Flammeovirga yaeyamensis TaxID=367791 RepID=A0AAX1N082_9BACT|nr:carboxymuconolactone decarboxylase family protein [Flammeovirga yaeyamensis]MBB3700279.1 AhpD family alkylhydroperoxidase [Flammeovirga yaeyamensis]NMF37095.1 carboxymuconolactone decarboxylase family protein [Flammeovirga yaeyamensis]QWG00786.1 carboxymuconolactone decarboxylase family protein [Flammeovirga yaeyamensis]
MDLLKEYRDRRSVQNQKVIDNADKVVKRIYSLDTITYNDGALDAKTKEMIGLTTSLVLRCDDCVKYHLEKCVELGYTKEQIVEGMAVGNVVGGTIVIPHLRRAVEYLEALFEEKANS